MPGEGVPAPRGAARDLYDLLIRLRADKASSSLRQIASKAGISPSYLSEILAGKKTPHADVAERLAAALGADDRGTRTARWYADRARAEETMPVPEPDRPYRLESLLPAARQPLGEASPSRLLATASAIVPFFGRKAELRGLTEWSDDRAHAMAAVLVHGPGGQGKTRLVQQFARQLGDWTVVQARHRMEPLPRTRPVSRNRMSSGAGVLVVVDYAERWPIADLLALAQDPRLSAADRCRLLLIARPAGGWWEVTRTRLRKLGVATSQLPLPSLALEPEERRASFVAARDAFAKEIGVRDAHLVGVPAHVDEEPFAHALTLHMAALVAVDAHTRNERSPDDPLAMSAYLLDRERDHWHSMYDKPAQALRTHPSTMARAVFTATACGPQTYDDGLALLDTAGVGGQGDEVLDDHSIVYPPTADGTVLEPLVPDRLGEDFLALQTVGHGRGEYSGDPWATTAVERLLLGAGAGAIRSQRYAGRALTVLIEAAHRWPHLVPTHLNPVLGRAPQLLLLAGSAAMTRFADLPGIDMRVCEALESAFIAQRHIGLDSGIAAIVRRLTTWRAAEAADPADSARLGINLGWRLAMAGRHQEALSATESAVQQLRSLPQEEIDKQAPALAASLRNLGVWLANVGRAEEALRTCREARGIYERLAAAHPDLHAGDYATALSNEALRLFQLGRHDEATDAARRSVAMHRQVVERDAAHTPFFAFSLINLAGMLRNRDVSEAVRVSTEGIEVARYAAALQPAAHTPTLAAALNTATGVLVKAGREAEAVAAAEESVGLYRVAVGANPDAFSLKLVSSLTNLSSALAAAGRLDAALDAAEEGVATHRRTLDADPHAYDPNVSLPRGLAWLAELRAMMGDIAEALDTAIESAKLTKGGAATDSVDHQSSLAELLGSLAADTARAGQPDKALPANVLRAELLRRLAEHDPDTYEVGLAVALVNLGARAMELGDTAAAFGAWGEAADIRRRLVAADSVTHGASLRSALYNLAVAHARAGRWEQVVETAEEALGVEVVAPPDEEISSGFVAVLTNAYEALFGDSRYDLAARAVELAAPLAESQAALEPVRLAGSHAAILGMLMIVRWQVGDREGSLEAGRQSIEIQRRHGSGSSHDSQLAFSLLAYGTRLRSMGQIEKALPVLRETVDAIRANCADERAHSTFFADALHELARAEIAAGHDLSAAMRHLEEAVRIRSALVQEAPEEHVPQLTELLRTVAEAAESLGMEDHAADLRSTLRQLLGENDGTGGGHARDD